MLASTSEVLNVRSGQWEPLEVAINAHADNRLTPADDYVRWPQGYVKVRVGRTEPHETRVYCALSGELGA